MSKSARFKCPQCEFTCGKCEAFSSHLLEHGHTSQESAYIEVHHSGTPPACRCGCGGRTRFSGWNRGFSDFIKGHNANVRSSYSEAEAERILSQRRRSLSGRAGWSRGLTKETDPRLLAAAQSRSDTVLGQFRRGERRAWSKGLTHETDERLARHREALIAGFESGEYTPWARGLTKQTDHRVAGMALKVSQTMSQREIRERLDSLKRLSSEEIVRRISEVPNTTLVGGVDQYRSDKDRCLEIQCKSCGLVQKKSLIEAMTGRCAACSPIGSQAQIEIDRYVRSLGFVTQISSRDVIPPYEVDTYVPDVGLAIEYNGLYFHSAIFKNKRYHSQKTALCGEAGVRLIHIFEDEWREKRDIVRSMIAHRLGVAQQRIGARTCKLIEISSSDRRQFFNENHIDGDVKSSACAALTTDDGKIVACMSLRRPMHKKYSSHLEVARFCTHRGVSVPGGLGKLTKWALTRAQEGGCQGLITYVDTRYGTGKSYTAAGWKQTGETPDRFWWTDGRHRIDRFKIRADKESGVSEKDIAAEHGVVKIWGCPNLIFEMRKE